MLKTLQGIALIAIIALTSGCGGGGGNGIISAPPQGLGALPVEMTGDWTVKNIGLPNDELTVGLGGQVFITSPATKKAVTIGKCSPDGSLELDGTWDSSQKKYEISGSGSINSSRSLSINATVMADATPIVENAQLIGARQTSRQFDTPPPPPSYE